MVVEKLHKRFVLTRYPIYICDNSLSVALEKVDGKSEIALWTCLFRIALLIPCTAQKMEFSTIDFFSKRDQIRSFLRISSHLLKKSLMENFSFCAVLSDIYDEVFCENNQQLKALLVTM